VGGGYAGSVSAGVFERVRRHWERCESAPTIRPGVRDDEVAAFEARYDVRLPVELIDYLKVANGLAAHHSDDELTGFWGLDRIQPAVSFYPHGQYSLTDVEARSWFIYCDVMIDSYWWAIRLDSERQGGAPVRTWGDGGDGAVVTVDSLTQFFEAYLADPRFPLR